MTRVWRWSSAWSLHRRSPAAPRSQLTRCVYVPDLFALLSRCCRLKTPVDAGPLRGLFGLGLRLSRGVPLLEGPLREAAMRRHDPQFRVAVRATEDGQFTFQIFTVSSEPRTFQADSPHYATPADAAQAGYDAIAARLTKMFPPRTTADPMADVLPALSLSLARSSTCCTIGYLRLQLIGNLASDLC